MQKNYRLLWDIFNAFRIFEVSDLNIPTEIELVRNLVAHGDAREGK